MTTVAQVKQAVQPLLQRNPDLALIGRLVVIKPVHHILRGVYIDRSLDPKLFVPTWSIIFIAEPRDQIGFHWGSRVFRPGSVWDISEPKLPEEMCEAIEREALPSMRSIKTIDDFVTFTSEERFPDTYLDLYPASRIFVDVARGDLEAASTICDYMRSDRAKKWYLPDMQDTYDRVTKELCPSITANDRPSLARLLHGYEAQSVKN